MKEEGIEVAAESKDLAEIDKLTGIPKRDGKLFFTFQILFFSLSQCVLLTRLSQVTDTK